MYNLKDGKFLEFLAKENKGIGPYDLEKQYEEMLSEVYGTIQICGYDYDAADALKSVDPTAFRCGLSDFSAEYIEVEVFENFENKRSGYDMYFKEEELEAAWEEYHDEMIAVEELSKEK